MIFIYSPVVKVLDSIKHCIMLITKPYSCLRTAVFAYACYKVMYYDCSVNGLFFIQAGYLHKLFYVRLLYEFHSYGIFYISSKIGYLISYFYDTALPRICLILSWCFKCIKVYLFLTWHYSIFIDLAAVRYYAISYRICKIEVLIILIVIL